MKSGYKKLFSALKQELEAREQSAARKAMMQMTDRQKI